MKRVSCLLLAGGAGSRLNILAEKRAKPAVVFGGIYRIIDFTISNVTNSGLERLGVMTQYKPLSLMDHLGTGRHWDFVERKQALKVLPPHTGRQKGDWYKGTADAVYQNVDYVRAQNPDLVLILSGDHIYNMDYGKLLRHHVDKGAALTVGLREVAWEDAHRFGLVETDDNDKVREFHEKPEDPPCNLASMGIYVFDAGVLLRELEGRIPADAAYDFGGDIIPGMMDRYPLYGYRFGGYWRDVGTVRSYWDAHQDLLRPGSGLDLRAWRVRTNLESRRFAGHPGARISSSAKVENSLVARGCVIEGEVRGSVLSPGVVVERGARVVDSILFHNTYVGRDALLNEVITDKDVSIGAGARLGEGDRPGAANKRFPTHLDTGIVLIGKGAHLPDGLSVGCNALIYPDLDPSDFPAAVPEGETVGAPIEG